MSALGEDHHTRERERLLEESDRLYELYGKPLEAEHWGEFVAISPDGRTLLGPSADEVGRAAREA
jgi:hypothetical protein